MRSNPRTSCYRSPEIGAGCSHSSRPRCGGCAVAPGSRERAGGSVAPAPLCVHRQTDENRHHVSCLVCAPLCRGGWAALPTGGAVCPGCRVPGARCGLRHDLAPASRLRGCATRSRLAKRLRAYRVPCAFAACVSGPAGLFGPPLARALSPFRMGVIL